MTTRNNDREKLITDNHDDDDDHEDGIGPDDAYTGTSRPAMIMMDLSAMDDNRYHLKSKNGYNGLQTPRQQLIELQDDIAVLRKILAEKCKREQELKTLLGIGIIDDVKQDILHSVSDLKKSNAYVKAAQGFRQTASKVQGIGDNVKRGWETIKDNIYVTSVENSLHSTWNNVRGRLQGIGAARVAGNHDIGLASGSFSIDDEQADTTAYVYHGALNTIATGIASQQHNSKITIENGSANPKPTGSGHHVVR